MTQVARPVSDVSNTNWTPSPVYVQIGGVNPNDSSPVSTNIPPGGTFVVQLSQLAAPVTGVHTLTVRLRKTDDSDLTATFALLQSGTTIASMTVSPTTTFTNFELELTDQEIDLITDYKNLQVTVIVNAGSGSGSTSGSISGSQIASGGSIASGSGPGSLTSASGLPVGSGSMSGAYPGSSSLSMSGSISGSGLPPISTTCCPQPTPAILHITTTGCSCLNASLSMTYLTGWGWKSESVDCLGYEAYFVLDCSGTDFDLSFYCIDAGIPSSTTMTIVSCDPSSFELSGTIALNVSSQVCCPVASINVSVTL